jgi:hypothetical protein
VTIDDRSLSPHRRRRQRNPLHAVLRQLLRPVHYGPHTLAVLPVPALEGDLQERANALLRATERDPGE